MSGGLLDLLKDEKAMARIEEHNRVIAKLADQLGCSRDEARRALFHYEAVTTSEGQVLN